MSYCTLARAAQRPTQTSENLIVAERIRFTSRWQFRSIIGLVVEYVVAIDVTRVRFPDDAHFEAGTN